jgi:hypothetical protein
VGAGQLQHASAPDLADASPASITARTDRGDLSPDAGRELRVGFSLTNLIHSDLSRKGDEPL